jgi:hypothetical protein
MQKLVYMKFGSHLYGTNTESSDDDFKGIYMPTKRQILLAKFPKSISTSTGDKHGKNGAGDIDDEMFSLHRFIELACEGQTVAIDMLHAPDSMIIESSDVWKAIAANRDKFYTKNLKAFVGYCRRQAAKYGVKGSRLNAAKEVIALLSGLPSDTRMRDVWSMLPTGEHIHHLEPNDKDTNKCKIYQVCGKKFLETVKVDSVIESLAIFVTAFGSRAELAAKNQGIDWKALSHAMRAAYQLEEIYTKGTIVFPLEQAGYLKRIKRGEADYLSEVAPTLEALMDRVEELSSTCELPENVDRGFWDDFLVSAVERQL